jgi:hypothetical protein
MLRVFVSVIVLAASAHASLIAQQRSGTVSSVMVFRGRPAPPASVPLRGLGPNTVRFRLPFFGFFGVPAFYLDSQITPLPADAPTGGVQLDVTPWRSSVYVDGMLKGRVDEFRGYYRPLTLTAGHHEIVIVDDGHQPLVLELFVTPGRTQTYRGTLSDALTF